MNSEPYLKHIPLPDDPLGVVVPLEYELHNSYTQNGMPLFSDR